MSERSRSVTYAEKALLAKTLRLRGVCVAADDLLVVTYRASGGAYVETCYGTSFELLPSWIEDARRV